MDPLELISAEVVLLSKEEGGRHDPLTAGAYDGRYRPHLVVEDRANREAAVEVKGGLQHIMDKYLGVAFWDGPNPLPTGSSAELTLALMYAPSIDYGEVVPGATFTLREGPVIVGHGIVKKRWQEAAE